MDESTMSKPRQVSFELIAAIVMGILAIGIFVFQAITVNSATTQLETVLFNLLQFLLTVGFAWFSGREVSKSEFEKSLKQFAIGAYRRITDIDKMLRRLQREVDDMLAIQPENQDNLQIIQAIVFDTCQVVQSSTDDWADVIGEELLAIQKIKRLERKKDEIELLDKTTGDNKLMDQNLTEIERKIDELRSNLPALLNISSQEKNGEKVMQMHYAELDEQTRAIMLSEFDAEQTGGNPYCSKALSTHGHELFPQLMRDAIRHGTEVSLAAALADVSLWEPMETYVREGVTRERKRNIQQSSERLATTEFSTWYVRGFARRLMDEGVTKCQVYRGAQPKWEPGDCAKHEGLILDIKTVYDNHRVRYWPEPGNKETLSIPLAPGCYHVIKRV